MQVGKQWTADEIRAECERKAAAERLLFCPEDEPGAPNEPDTVPDEPGAPGAGGRFPSQFVLKCLSENQEGDAKLFRAIHRGRFLYDHSARAWFWWSGNYWETDRVELVVADLQAVCNVYETELQRISWQLNQAKTKEETEHLKSIEKALRKRKFDLQGESRITAVLKLARTGFTEISTAGDAWDSEPMLLAVKNGVIDLTTGSIRAGLPGDMIKTYCHVEWLGLDAPCFLWEKAIQDIFPSDVVDYVQKLIGYSVTGKITHHFLVICHGAGSNGKSLFFESLGSVLGDHAFQIPSETLLACNRDSGGGQSRSDIMALRGRRLCYTQEINSRRSLDLAKSKLLTGNDTVSARELYGKQTTFKPSWKIFMITNNRPNADANDFGIWRRLVLLPFERQFVENPTVENERLIDYDLPEKLKAEFPGILAWAVRGCLKWQAEGLQPPERVRAATTNYRAENDTIQQFIVDACLVMAGVRIRSGELYAAYQKFCTDEGLEPESQTAFSKQMKARFKAERTMSARWFIGISLKADENP